MNTEVIYQKRLHLVIDFISTHLSESISLSEMANIAGFSNFHFHRLFTAIIGESPADFVQRLRLELAVNYLTKTQRSITQISFECGFSNASTFARAFRQQYQVSPSQYRSGKNPTKIFLQDNNLNCQNPSNQFVFQSTRIQEFQDMPVIYMACYEGYKLEKVCQIWDYIFRWASMRNLLDENTHAIGIALDDPQFTNQKQCRYYACLPAPIDTKVISPISSMIIPGGQYAVFRSKCKSNEIYKMYCAIYRNWLPASGYQPANSFPLEIYHRIPEQHPQDLFDLEVCIPVEPVHP